MGDAVRPRRHGPLQVTTLSPTPVPSDETELQFSTRLGVADEMESMRLFPILFAAASPPEAVFAVITAEAGRLRDADLAVMSRYDEDGAATVVGAWARDGVHPLPPGTRFEPGAEPIHTLVFETRRPVSVDDGGYFAASGTADRQWAFRSCVGAPISIAGQLWGQIGMAYTREELLPSDSEVWLAGFTELVAAVVANVQARVELRQIADEQAALRRVAVLVARAASPEDIFAAVSDEIDAVFGSAGWVVRFESDGSGVVFVGVSKRFDLPVGTRFPFGEGMASAEVYRTGRAARIEGVEWSSIEGAFAETSMRLGTQSSVSCPIIVEDRLWGAVVLTTNEGRLPPDTEKRLAGFTELVATAIADADSREAVRGLADEQAALRRAATLVIEGVEPAEIFSAVCDEVGRAFGSDKAAVVRFEVDPPGIVVVGLGSGITGIPIGTRAPLGEGLAPTEVRGAIGAVYRTGRSARNDDWRPPGPRLGHAVGRLGLVATVASPIVVEGRVWGATSISAREALPPDTEQRLERFAELLATAIANAESRDALAQVAEEQAALRRVAILVAQGVPPSEIFSAVSDEVGRLFSSVTAAVARFEADPPGLVLVGVGSGIPDVAIGQRSGLEEGLASTQVHRTGRSARVDVRDWHATGPTFREPLQRLGLVSAVASPIVVEGGLWGTMNVLAREPLPPDTEQRLERFAGLLATAIANAESRDALAQVAKEQAALRRVATLVAQGVRPSEIFSTVSVEVGRACSSDTATIDQFDGDPPGIVIVRAAHGISDIAIGQRFDADPPIVIVGPGHDIPDTMIGQRSAFEEGLASTQVYRTGRPARIDARDWDAVGSAFGEPLRRLGLVASVASPIVVEGRLWGTMNVLAREPLPPDTERRLENFSELVATAIANAEGKSELEASRRRIVTASDEARRRIERDLHDGTQQRLVSLALAVRSVEATAPPDRLDLRDELGRIATGLSDAVAELQEISRGIHPAVLARGGLGVALRSMARRSAIPVEIDIAPMERLPEQIEVAAYYAASEALANATKHSNASHVEISLTCSNGLLRLFIDDDGIGGAEVTRGSGLVGLIDRIEALRGTIRIRSQSGGGTQIAVELPLDIDPPHEHAEKMAGHG